MKCSQPEISVLMSVYNETIDELSKSVESILRQTRPDFEFIIVIDHPNRKELIDYLQESAKQDDRIIVIQNTENIGLAACRNKALVQAKGRLIARMDADDISLP